ncbi:unnamed protein product [Effrenium voratum]|nr:unnamed protein product [Effrenium voratum]
MSRAACSLCLLLLIVCSGLVWQLDVLPADVVAQVRFVSEPRPELGVKQGRPEPEQFQPEPKPELEEPEPEPEEPQEPGANGPEPEAEPEAEELAEPEEPKPPKKVPKPRVARKEIVQVTKDWKFFKAHQHHWKALKGLRVLDVGMGQGPIGVVALATGVQHYVGLDPAVRIHELPQARKIGQFTKAGEPVTAQFPFSGADMMAAYPEKLVLLQGTFETLRDDPALKPGAFDIATLFSVSEHLPNITEVWEGVFNVLKPGQLFLYSHHNYYSFSGHHALPKEPKKFVPNNEEHRKVAFWRHLDQSSPPFSDVTMNRIRLGDLMAITGVFFNCVWEVRRNAHDEDALKPGVFQPLQRRGFEAAELLTNRLLCACQRRPEPRQAPWLQKVWVHHPPTDGSYQPQPLPPEIQQIVSSQSFQHAFIGAIAIGDMVKSTLGPKGMDKILQPANTTGPNSNATVTNDGATILKSVWIDNPAARILVDISKTQDQECGDGTPVALVVALDPAPTARLRTSVVVLAAEMLRNAQNLVEAKMHPQVIIRGYRLALAAARERLEALAMDNGRDPTKFREDLLRIARTTLSSKLLQHEKDHFATLAVDAVLRLGGKPNLDYIQVLKKPGASLKESFLEEGFILEKRIGVGHKKVLEDCKVLVANCQMDTDKIKIYGARVKVDSLEAVAEIEQAEKDKMKTKIEKIAAHKCNVFINRQLIYNYPDQLLKDAGVMAIEHSDFDGSERLAAVLGADIVSTFDNPELTTLGSCKRIEEIMIGEDKVIKFSGCSKGEACTIVLRGSSMHVLDEAERSLHDALAVLFQTVQETRVVWGGGSMEMAMAQAVQQKLTEVGGKESVAMEQFGKALMQIPIILADNAGLDSAELVGQLRAAHAKGENSVGLEFFDGTVADMSQLGIMESFRSKMSQLCSAAEAAEMIIRVDDIIKNAPRQREG